MFDYVRAQRDDVNFFIRYQGAVNRLLIEGIAKAGLGEPFVVTEASEAAEAAVRLRRYIDTPVLTGSTSSSQASTRPMSSPSRPPTSLPAARSSFSEKWRGKPAGSIEISGQTGRGRTRRRFPSPLQAPM